MMAAVMLEDVVKRYGPRPAVDGVTLAVAAGERLALLGHNGAGKTTLMKLLLGLVAATAGRVTVLGERPGDIAAPGRRAIGFMPESVAFHDALTGAEVMTFYARLKGCPMGEVPALLERIGLAAAANRRVSTYSKGMRQRLGLAQALLGRPRLLLLDEPTSGLDPELRQAFYQIVRDSAAAGGTVILSSHVLTELERHADRVAIMAHGRMVALGTLDELRARAALPVTIRARLATDGTREWTVAPERKLDALRAALALAPADVAVIEPGLDDLYTHFLTGTAPCPC